MAELRRERRDLLQLLRPRSRFVIERCHSNQCVLCLSSHRRLSGVSGCDPTSASVPPLIISLVRSLSSAIEQTVDQDSARGDRSAFSWYVTASWVRRNAAVLIPLKFGTSWPSSSRLSIIATVPGMDGYYPSPTLRVPQL